MLKRLSAVILSLFLLTSCADRREIDDFAYVIAIGIDVIDEGLYEFTLASANVNSIGETKKEKGANMSAVSASAADFYTALDMINNNVSKKINLAHTKLIVFSEKVARLGIKQFVNSFVRELKIRPGTVLAVSENSKEYLERLNPLLEINPEKYFKEIFESGNTNYAIGSYLSDFFYSANGVDIQMTLPFLCVEDEKDEKSEIEAENKAMISGIAYFNKDKMIGKGSNNENICRLLLSGEYEKIAYGISNENFKSAVLISQSEKPKIRVECDAVPKICAEIFLNCEEVYFSEYTKKNYSYEEIEKITKKDLENSLKKYLYYTSNILKVDSENFSKIAKRHFATQTAWEKYNWNEKYKNADFSVEVHTFTNYEGILKEGDDEG